MEDEKHKEPSQVLGRCQHEVWLIGSQMQSLGILLERQGVESEGFTELFGLGVAMREAGERLDELARDLDAVRFTFPNRKRVKRKGKDPKA